MVARPAKLEKGVESENIPPVPVEEEEGGCGPPPWRRRWVVSRPWTRGML